MQIHSDCAVINDAYPKARCHGLVIARTAGLNGPPDLRAEHLPLLQAMQVRQHHGPTTVSTWLSCWLLQVLFLVIVSTVYLNLVY